MFMINKEIDPANIKFMYYCYMKLVDRYGLEGFTVAHGKIITAVWEAWNI